MAALKLPDTEVTCIVVTRGMEGLLRFCLDGLRRALAIVGCGHEIVLVDNATPFPVVSEDIGLSNGSTIRFDSHTSFAAANNAAAGLHPNPYYLLLNNDVLLAEGAIKGMLSLLESTPGAGICGTRMLFPDGTLQHCGVVFGPGNTGPYHLQRRRPAQLVSRHPAEFQAVTGACMLIRDTVWQQIDGLDEAYPFGLEDIDFCLRARQNGWRVVCDSSVDSLHFEAATPGRSKLDRSSRQLFMKRWTRRYMIDG